jgi:hypothetical protein
MRRAPQTVTVTKVEKPSEAPWPRKMGAFSCVGKAEIAAAAAKMTVSVAW